jgi:hypothetical protein
MAGKAHSYRPSDIKKLFAFSANKCAKPGCQNPMISNDGSTVLGEIAHIAAASSGGPRYNNLMTDDDRRGIDNLILLCETHHKQIDTNVSRYPTDLLKEWKSIHEDNPAEPEIEVSDAIVKKAIAKTAAVKTNTYVIIGLLLVVLGAIIVLVVNPSLVGSSFDQEVEVHWTDVASDLILRNEGKVTLDYENGKIDAPIVGGIAQFRGISSEFCGNEVQLLLKAEGWEIVKPKDKYILNDEPIQLEIRRDSTLGIIRGIIKSSDETEVIVGAEIIISTKGGDTTIYSKKGGRFRVVLPTKMQVSNKIKRYTLNISADGYFPNDWFCKPLSNCPVRLDKRQ